MKIGIIIQARMGSTRLPDKVLKRIGDKNLLEHILFRLSQLEQNTKIVIATTILEKDDLIEKFCKKNKFRNYSTRRDPHLYILRRLSYLQSKGYCYGHTRFLEQ